MLTKLIENCQKTQLHDTVLRPRDTNIQRFFMENRLQIIGIQLFGTIQIWQFLSGKASNQNKDCITHDILARAILLVTRHLRVWPHFTYSSYTSNWHKMIPTHSWECTMSLGESKVNAFMRPSLRKPRF